MIDKCFFKIYIITELIQRRKQLKYNLRLTKSPTGEKRSIRKSVYVTKDIQDKILSKLESKEFVGYTKIDIANYALEEFVDSFAAATNIHPGKKKHVDREIMMTMVTTESINNRLIKAVEIKGEPYSQADAINYCLNKFLNIKNK